MIENKSIMDLLNEKVIRIYIDNSKFQISKKSLLEFMGYKNNDYPPPLDDVFDHFFDEMDKHYKPEAGFKIFENIKIEENGFYCDEIFFNTGNIIAEKLKYSEYLVFFMVTVGIDFDKWNNISFKNDNTLLGYTIDCAGSELAEELAYITESYLFDICKKEEYLTTNRYSPGYCGWNTNEQKLLFSLFPENFCNIHLTELFLMNPVKSISGVIGVGKNVKKIDYQCSICDKKDCFRRKK